MKNIYTIITLFISIFLCVNIISAQEENNNGAFRISIGGDYVEPHTLAGDDPNIPPKPKRQFNTNSIFLNQILNSCENYEDYEKTMALFTKMQRVFYADSTADLKQYFMVVYITDTKEIVALMDKGTGKRCNLLTNQFETNDLYSDEKYSKVWFRIEE